MMPLAYTVHYLRRTTLAPRALRYLRQNGLYLGNRSGIPFRQVCRDLIARRQNLSQKAAERLILGVVREDLRLIKETAGITFGSAVVLLRRRKIHQRG